MKFPSIQKSPSNLPCWFASCETMRKWGTASSMSVDAFVTEKYCTGYVTDNLNIYKESPFLENVPVLTRRSALFITISVSFHSCHCVLGYEIIILKEITFPICISLLYWTLKTLSYLKKWVQTQNAKAHIWQFGVKCEGYKLKIFFLQFFLQTPPLSFCYLPADTLREPVFTHLVVKFVKRNFF